MQVVRGVRIGPSKAPRRAQWMEKRAGRKFRATGGFRQRFTLPGQLQGSTPARLHPPVPRGRRPRPARLRRGRQGRQRGENDTQSPFERVVIRHHADDVRDHCEWSFRCNFPPHSRSARIYRLGISWIKYSLLAAPEGGHSCPPVTRRETLEKTSDRLEI